MIIVMQNRKGVTVGINDDGSLYLKGYAPHPPTQEYVPLPMEFRRLYTRPCLTGGMVTRYEREDGLTLRRFVEAGREWWDTGDCICAVTDIDAARNERRAQEQNR